MSELLGHNDCMKSLRKDLVDIQGAIMDVVSRTGPISYTSWKFPNKLASDLDLVDLLEEYDFVDGEDAYNQHSHVVLLELVVDRLLFLLQSVSVYTELQRGRQGRDQIHQKGCLSVGLVVRNYWGTLLQCVNRKENSKDIKQTKTKTLDYSKTESYVSSPTSSSTHLCRNCSSASFSPTSPQKSEHSGPTHNAPFYSKAKHHNTACQTTTSSLIPCEACHRVQSLLRNTGDALIDLFQSEGLPSSLKRLSGAMKDTVGPGQMTAGDVTQWAQEQLRDMRCLAKHLQDVQSTIRPLREALAKAETDRNGFSSQLVSAKKEFQQEVEKHQVCMVQLESSLQKAERTARERQQRLQEEQKQSKREILSLEESNTRLKEKVKLQQETLETLVGEKEGLQQKVETLQREEETCCELQQMIQKLETQLSDTRLRLDKEKAKYQSAFRQQESMQAKQKSLLKRVDALDEEREELQRQLEEKEEVQTNLDNQLKTIIDLKEQQQAELSQQQDICRELQKEKQTLQTRVEELEKHVAELMEHVQALRERERLLVAFPELNNWAHIQPQSTGNLILDMEQQQQSNNIRIKILEQENFTLHKSLEKLRQRGMLNITKEAPSQPT
ncbi:coiled-coil domain-containing protein 157 isoform X1 [Xiphophorus couchianus]|uniref:coiled-coil domain-containing protein 157 isoform X1 n=1 Tax=Xiphophorus couchianus TaxID=32473 RepID=UPI0010160BF5|nr:coiled-coil domain-containing protein 157 isoform X1 [Xiphophorus couchianus]